MDMNFAKLAPKREREREMLIRAAEEREREREGERWRCEDLGGRPPNETLVFLVRSTL